MGIKESTALDIVTLLQASYELGEMLNASKEMAEYLYWKSVVQQDEEAKRWIAKLQQQKDRFEECQRFGHFHPEYHAALEQVRQVQEKLDAIPSIQRFKQAEDRLDELLYEVSKLIAHSVSESVKVPTDRLVSGRGCGSCGNGGSCGGCG